MLTAIKNAKRQLKSGEESPSTFRQAMAEVRKNE